PARGRSTTKEWAPWECWSMPVFGRPARALAPVFSEGATQRTGPFRTGFQARGRGLSQSGLMQSLVRWRRRDTVGRGPAVVVSGAVWVRPCLRGGARSAWVRRPGELAEEAAAQI